MHMPLTLSAQTAEWYVHKDLRNKTADATRRYNGQPMELQPGSWAEPTAVTWGLRILDEGRFVVQAPHDEGAARSRGLHFCCINHTTPTMCADS